MFTTFIILVATEVTTALQCSISTSPVTVNLTTRVVNTIFTALAVIGVVRLYLRLKAELKPHKALSKLICLKALVFVAVGQSIIFGVLAKSVSPQPAPKLSYLDVTVGLPNVLVSCEMVLFSLLFLWAYPASSYRRATLSTYGETTTATRTRLGCGSAILDLLNVSDIFAGVWIAGKILVRLPFGKKNLGYEIERAQEYATVAKKEST